jgi:hypothetical protein
MVRLEAETIGPDEENLADAVCALVLSLHRPDALAGDATAAPPAALAARMQQHIEHHLDERDLSPERIARAHYISTRQLHKLFAADGVSVSAWIRGRRLDPSSTRRTPANVVAPSFLGSARRMRIIAILRFWHGPWPDRAARARPAARRAALG